MLTDQRSLEGADGLPEFSVDSACSRIAAPGTSRAALTPERPPAINTAPECRPLPIVKAGALLLLTGGRARREQAVNERLLPL